MPASTSSTRQSGFSLIELLIVVLIVGTLAAIAVPNFLESKQAAHNASAISSLRLIYSSEVAYRAANAQFADLATLRSTGYLHDPLLGTGQRSNYTFTMPPASISANFYEVTAAPGVAPWRFYYMNASGVIRTRVGAAADSSSPPINY